MIPVHEFDKCLIFGQSGNKSAEGLVNGFSDGQLRINIRGENAVSINQSVDVFIYNAVKGECQYTGVIDHYEGDNVIIKNVEFSRSSQKRNDTRVDKMLRYEITQKFEADEKAELDTPVSITILNISANGMYMACDRKFEIGYRFPLVFRDAGRPIDLKVEIVRQEELPRGFKYGCTFIDISEKDAENIFRMVLHEQIEQRRRHFVK